MHRPRTRSHLTLVLNESLHGSNLVSFSMIPKQRSIWLQMQSNRLQLSEISCYRVSAGLISFPFRWDRGSQASTWLQSLRGSNLVSFSMKPKQLAKYLVKESPRAYFVSALHVWLPLPLHGSFSMRPKQLSEVCGYRISGSNIVSFSMRPRQSSKVFIWSQSLHGFVFGETEAVKRSIWSRFT